MSEGDTFLNAVIGAVISIVGSVVLPFAPLFGGAVAGYLQGGDRSDGLRVGFISGLIALVPALLVVVFVLMVFGVILTGSGAVGISVFAAFIALFVLVIGVIYMVGFSILGGWIGNYVKHDTDIDI